jgi:hypothetical protein
MFNQKPDQWEIEFNETAVTLEIRRKLSIESQQYPKPRRS